MDTDSRPCIFVSSITTGYGAVRAAASHALITERKSYSNDCSRVVSNTSWDPISALSRLHEFGCGSPRQGTDG